MAKRLNIFVREDTFEMYDDEIRKCCPENIRVFYGFDTYGCNLVHINELRECILKDYPNTKDEDIEVRFISRHESIIHAMFTMLTTPIPIEDFIKLRADRQIFIL